MGDADLELSGVTKRYGEFVAVDRVTFSAPKGRIVGLLGPNGAGKTSTLRMILGITPPSAGKVTVFGRQPGRSVQRRIGYLPEERGLYRRMSARDTVIYFAKLKGMWAGRARRRADALLDELGLGHVKERRVEALSKGMAQKVQLITAIAHEPELVILDEPFSGLDPINQNELEAAIKRLATEGKTILFSTHTMSQAERLCDRFVILVKGRKAFDGTLDEARAVVPRRIKLEAAGDLGFLRGVKGVAELIPPEQGSTHWEVVLTKGADPQTVLAACFEHGVKLTLFDTSPPSLHEAFVALAGGDVGDAEP
jgi:ABC-2 type transport system ATP-binding protein